MFDDNKIVIPENKNEETQEYEEKNWQDFRKPIFIGIAALLLISIIIVTVVLVKKRNNQEPVPNMGDNSKQEEQIDPNKLPDLNGDDSANGTSTYPFNPGDLNIEYLSFSDFYQAPENNFSPNIDDYQLPINIKVDGFNYYSLSRKINLDPVVDDLNNYGFAVLDNPWKNEANDFYAIYKHLESKQIPLLITSDFMIYYYQNMLKQIYKEIEEEVFYDYLWAINTKLYQISKNRYETRLALVGDINDPILEGQRMEMAFFAVALELLKPAPGQVAIKGAIEDRTKFTEGDVETFNFNAPSYLRDNVIKEAQLIKSARDRIKSPNLLYIRDYSEFTVPKEYRSDAKLNNFYLASTWLSSLFPLEYRSDACPDCLLDKEDWRLNMIAASLISSDLSANDNLKSQWAIIYKLMAFFQGLREEIDYVDFRDSLIASFGEDYDIEQIFSGEGEEVIANLEKLKKQLLSYNFSAIRGAIDKNKPENTKKLGFKILTDAYWPNDYIFSHLTWPKIGLYEGQKPKEDNVTACNFDRQIVRCNSFSLDIANLVSPMKSNPIFIENSNYRNYESSASTLIKQLNRDGIWHTSNYWSTISLMKTISENDIAMPVFTLSSKWQEQKVNTAVSAWINLQVPLDNFSLTPLFEGNTLDSFFKSDENIYVEPNYALISELLAINNMIEDTFAALGLNNKINLAAQSIKNIDEDLKMLQRVIEKELRGEAIEQADGEDLLDFAKRYQIDSAATADNILKHSPAVGGKLLVQDIRELQLMALVHKVNNNKVVVVGPVWNYKESR